MGVQIYGTGADSTIGTQLNTFYYQKKALIDLVKKQFFGQLADITSMPKHMGKTIKRYHYLPLLDDANINDQGIDAGGRLADTADTNEREVTIMVVAPDATGTATTVTTFANAENLKNNKKLFVGNDADPTDATAKANAIIAAKLKVIQWTKNYFPNVYYPMAHGGTSGINDYALIVAESGKGLQVDTITIGVITLGDTVTIKYGDTSISYTVATATVTATVAGLINHANYDAMPFVLTSSGAGATSGTLIMTWKTYGYDPNRVVVTYTGTLTATIPAANPTTLGKISLWEMGYRFFNADGTITVDAGGNLYGSSKDIGTIVSKLPTLTETGGRVNRVGFKRIELEGSINKFGFFDEYTQESLDFDTDEQLEEHVHREMLRGANEITEDALQIDLINGAGVVRYAGAAYSNDTMTGNTVDTICEVSYNDLMRLSIDLDNNRCPKHTKIITGSRMTDTKVINAARIMYCGSEMIPTFMNMKDLHNNPAFIPVAQYAEAGSLLNGEIGTVGDFRICIVPEMMHWDGSATVGAVETDNAGYRATADHYDIYPLLVVGDESFTTIGFQTDGKSTKFKVIHKKPGEATATAAEPYGELGFMSIKWYYGMMVLRAERIALVKSLARL